MKMQQVQFSKKVSDFLEMLSKAKSDYKWHYDEVNRLDYLTQDYLHKLELEGLNYAERAKIATQLAQCRQSRRMSKDTVEALTPLIEFLESPKGRDLNNLLKEVLGKTRKVEERMKTREYGNRVLQENK